MDLFQLSGGGMAARRREKQSGSSSECFGRSAYCEAIRCETQSAGTTGAPLRSGPWPSGSGWAAAQVKSRSDCGQWRAWRRTVGASTRACAHHVGMGSWPNRRSGKPASGWKSDTGSSPQERKVACGEKPQFGIRNDKSAGGSPSSDFRAIYLGLRHRTTFPPAEHHVRRVHHVPDRHQATQNCDRVARRITQENFRCDLNRTRQRPQW